MSDTAKKLFDGLRAAKEGLQANLQEGGAQVKGELARQGVQGSMEMASGIFSQNSFVPYGPGQYTPSIDQQQQRNRDHGVER